MNPDAYFRRYFCGGEPESGVASGVTAKAEADDQSPLLLELTRLVLGILKSRRLREDGAETGTEPFPPLRHFL
jgi:hypothetical protein